MSLQLEFDILIPENMLAFYCSVNLDAGKKKKKKEKLDELEEMGYINPLKYVDSEGHYNLKKIDPKRLDRIIKLIQSAPDNQIKPVWREKNTQFRKLIKDYNDANPGQPKMKAQDVVRMIDTDHYAYSYIGNRGALLHKEVHVFLNIDVPGITENQDTEVYIKFTTPNELWDNDTTVVSTHHNSATDYNDK